jgi:hypothetical protein
MRPATAATMLALEEAIHFHPEVVSCQPLHPAARHVQSCGCVTAT